LPLSGKNLNEVAEDCHPRRQQSKKKQQALKKPAYETLPSFMRWLFSQQIFVDDG
jgi:hypothetical protein